MSTVVRTVEPRGEGVPGCTIIESVERITESYADYLTDESGFGPPKVDCLVFARSERQVADVLADASDRGVYVTVSAGRTGIVGGAVPAGGTLLSLAEMNRVLGIRRLADGRFAVRVEPAVTVAGLEEMLAVGDLGLDPETLPPEEAAALAALKADERGYFYPPDPTEMSAHLGATVATNASGARSYYYGATRRHVHSVRVVLPCGEVIAAERGIFTAGDGRFEIRLTGGDSLDVAVPGYAMPETKNAAGYYVAPDVDLVDLFIGSEGTLGVLTEVELVLSRRPSGVLSALAFFPDDESAIAFVKHTRGDHADSPVPASVTPLALEFFDSKSFEFLRERKEAQGASSGIPELPEDAAAGVLFEQEFEDEDALMAAYEGWEELLSHHGSSMENTWGGMEESDLARLKALRHSIAEEVNGTIARARAKHPEIHKIGTDIAVPAGRFEEMVAYYRERLAGTTLRYVMFGHIGDSHVHLNIMPQDLDELLAAEKLALEFAKHGVSMGGTVSGEHGIGRLKHAFLEALYGAGGLVEMAALKAAFDPAGILNRGVMFPSYLLEHGSRRAGSD